MTLHLPSVLRRCLCIITLLIFLFAALPPFSTVAALDTTPKVYTPSASGKKVVGNSKAKIDISNVDQGYLMVVITETAKRLNFKSPKKVLPPIRIIFLRVPMRPFLSLKAAEPIL